MLYSKPFVDDPENVNDMWVIDQLLNNLYFQQNKDNEMETLSTRMQLRYDKVINQPFT